MTILERVAIGGIAFIYCALAFLVLLGVIVSAGLAMDPSSMSRIKWDVIGGMLMVGMPLFGTAGAVYSQFTPSK